MFARLSELFSAIMCTTVVSTLIGAVLMTEPKPIPTHNRCTTKYNIPTKQKS